MDQLVIPEFSNSFEDSVSKVVLLSKQCLKQSELKYKQAEELLLAELGLEDWQPTEETVAVKSFAESFLSSGRLDSEHYKPKYDQAVEKINSLNPIEVIHIEDILIDITNGQSFKT